jgi:hypothetical protein
LKTVFAFTSWGNAGVPWLLACLNSHPQVRAVSCLTHGAYSPLGREIGATDYLDAVGRIGWADKPVCGDVHGVSPHEFPNLHATFGDTFRGCHLVGHPIPRLAGSLAFSKAAGRDWRYRDFLRTWNMDPGDSRATSALVILGEEGDYIPAHYMINVNSVVDVCGVDGPKADPLFSLESLMADDGAWVALLAHLSAGTIAESGGHWEAFRGQLMGIAHQPFGSTPRAVWDGLDEYVRLTVAAHLTDEARAVYEALGYDLSFVR